MIPERNIALFGEKKSFLSECTVRIPVNSDFQSLGRTLLPFPSKKCLAIQTKI